MKEDKYTKSLAKISGLCNSSYARYSEKRFTQIYKALYGDVMFVSAALKHGIRNREAETESRKRKRKRNSESNTNDRKLKNFTLHKLVI